MFKVKTITSRNVGFTLFGDQYEKAKSLAEAKEVTVSELVRQMVKYALDEAEPVEKAEEKK